MSIGLALDVTMRVVVAMINVLEKMK